MIAKDVLGLVDSTGDAAFAIDRQGVIVAWNQPAEKLLGISKKRAVGLFCWKVLEGLDECGPICSKDCLVLRSWQQRRPLENFDMQIPTTRGRRWCNISTLRLPRQDATSSSLSVHVLRVIDVRKRLEMALQEFVGSTAGLPKSAIGQITFLSRTPVRGARLTARQSQTLELMASGQTSREIAAQLGIRLQTARNHVQDVLRKLGARNRMDAVRKATRAGLLRW